MGRLRVSRRVSRSGCPDTPNGTPSTIARKPPCLLGIEGVRDTLGHPGVRVCGGVRQDPHANPAVAGAGSRAFGSSCVEPRVRVCAERARSLAKSPQSGWF